MSGRGHGAGSGRGHGAGSGRGHGAGSGRGHGAGSGCGHGAGSGCDNRAGNGRDQLPLAFPLHPSHAAGDFLVSPCNAEAVRWLERWPAWPEATLLLTGPSGCGKTHLACAFACRCEATLLTQDHLSDIAALADSPARVFIADDADRLVVGGDGDEAALLHLYNLVREQRRSLLLTTEWPAAQWGMRLADLRSRLLATPTVAIAPPDEELLASLLVKLFADRQLKVGEDVVLYLMPRIERSFAAVRQAVADLDAAALADRRDITIPFVRAVLGARAGDA